MTVLEMTRRLYQAGDKKTAYVVFKNDPDALEGVTFENFCIAFDKIVKGHAENKAAEKSHALAMAMAG